MKIAIQGLGRMGMQIAERLVREGHEVIAHNRSPEPLEKAATFGARTAATKQDVVTAFEGGKVVVWIMLPAEIVEEHLREWLDIVPKGSLLIDGGNSDFRLTKQHAALVEAADSEFVDVGTSGGIRGFEHGFSMMVGGHESGFKTLEPALQSLAKPHGGYRYFGASGAGHYVKMVHNAIEYGMMESLAEGYRLLKEGAYENLDLAAAGGVWQTGSVIESLLNELSAEALHENPELDGITGTVAESGEARWALEFANEKNIPLPAIKAAFDVRLASQQNERNFATKLLAAMRNKFGGHNINA
ncbi:MAG TPA: NADP-dependent phosphogluconate dehydrogenase [Candidatus Saccharimonadales bacterium]|nr:NADP-dependent phosphogluconate dehydrogenase [Candidatus Saccharimonadales bacterium]